MEANSMIALFDIGSAVFWAAIAIPLARRKVKMNYLYGIRTPKAFESEANWYNINALVGKQMLIWSIPSLVIGIACFFIPITGPDDMLLALLLTAVPMCANVGVPFWHLWRYERTL